MAIRNLGQRRTDIMGRLDHNFSRWDANGDGKIVHREFKNAMQDETVQGRDAAALATLYDLAAIEKERKDLKNLPSFTKADMEALRTDYFETSEPHNIDYDYQYFCEKLDGRPTVVFSNGLPNAMLGRQGTAPSCGFLAPLFQKAHQDPESVAQMVTRLDNGDYSVHFPGDEEPVEVTPPTDAEVAYYSSAADGTWLTLMEKAWAKRQEEIRHPRRRKTRPFEEAVTFTGDAITALTGNDYKAVKLPQTSPSYEKGETPRFMSAIARAIAKDDIVTANVPKGESKLEGLPDWHYYSVTSWDEDQGLVGIRNPWGSGEPVDATGKARDGRNDGRFEMPLEEFIANFRYVTREES